MSRRALVALGAVFVAGLVAVGLVAGLEERSQAFTLGVVPAGGVARLGHEREVCQRPVEVLEPFERVALQVATFDRAGQPFAVEVRDTRSNERIARAEVEGGYADSVPQVVPLPRTIEQGTDVAVCVRNLGDRPIAPYGNSGLSTRTSAAYVEGERTELDMALSFQRDEPATVLGELPSIVERASLFHGRWGSPVTYWILLAVLLVAPVVAAAFALRAAVRDST